MSPDNIGFPNWVPPEAQQTWIDFYSVAQNSSASVPFPEALKVLQRLATRQEMKDAWAELKHFPDVSPSELMGITFIVWLLATLNRLRRKFPHFESNHDRELASMIHVVTDALRGPAIRAGANITDTTLRDLERAAAIYEQKVKNSDVLLSIAAPPKKAGARTADQTAFVYAMCDWLGQRTGRLPYILVAILANVAFKVSKKHWDADRVKQCLRSRSRKSRPGTLLARKHCNVHRLI